MADRSRLKMTRRIATLPLLLKERGSVSKVELAGIFEVTGKTIWRDLKVLSEIYPITSELRGRQVYYCYDHNREPTLKKLISRKHRK